MAERLEKVFSAQRQLLSDASHELRSPLARLQVALGLARQRSNGQADKELDRIELEIERLNELIGQLLELSRLEAGVVPHISSRSIYGNCSKNSSMMRNWKQTQSVARSD